MKQETGYFSSIDGTRLFYRAWNKDTENCLIILHGIGEHSGRYQEFALSLEDVPFSVFSVDLRGHGQSEGKRVHVRSFQDFVDDLYAFRLWIETTFKKKTFVLLGQSLGGLIATSVVLRNQSVWRSLILMSPFFKIYQGHHLLGFLTGCMNQILPDYIWHNPIRAQYLSHDLEEVKKYLEDKMIQRAISTRLAHEMFQACTFVYNHAQEIKLPVLILAAGDDRIVSLKATQHFYNAISSQQKELKIFDSSYHELIHEKERAEAVTIIRDFLTPDHEGLPRFSLK